MMHGQQNIKKDREVCMHTHKHTHEIQMLIDSNAYCFLK